MVDVAILVDLFLAGVLVEDIIEVKVLASHPIVDLDLFPASTHSNAVIHVSVAYLALQEGPDSDGRLYFTTHDNNFISEQLAHNLKFLLLRIRLYIFYSILRLKNSEYWGNVHFFVEFYMRKKVEGIRF